ncbi:hypothetical protein ACVIF9_003651 [Bradyrhizobium sp. USDA 4350]
MPATICMATPSTQPAMITAVQAMSGSLRSTTTPTEKNATMVARKVPIALSNSAVSILRVEVPSFGWNSFGGVSMPT